MPPGLRFQGFPVGTLVSGRFRPQARCRLLLPAFAPETGLNATALSRIQALLTGQSLPAGELPARPGLYCHDLPLGWLTRKGARILKIILFGSHARGDHVDAPLSANQYKSDYDILVIVSQKELTDRAAY